MNELLLNPKIKMFASMLPCFRHLSTLPVQEAASKRLVLVPELEDTGLDREVDKRVEAGCSFQAVDTAQLLAASC